MIRRYTGWLVALAVLFLYGRVPRTTQRRQAETGNYRIESDYRTQDRRPKAVNSNKISAIRSASKTPTRRQTYRRKCQNERNQSGRGCRIVPGKDL